MVITQEITLLGLVLKVHKLYIFKFLPIPHRMEVIIQVVIINPLMGVEVEVVVAVGVRVMDDKEVGVVIMVVVVGGVIVEETNALYVQFTMIVIVMIVEEEVEGGCHKIVIVVVVPRVDLRVMMIEKTAIDIGIERRQDDRGD